MRQQHAFTLLELLVVLSLIGLVAGIMAPRFFDLSQRLSVRNELLEVRQKLNGMPLLALRNGASVRIDAQGAPLQLPDGWRLTAPSPVLYQSNGSCLGGTVEVWRGKTLQARADLLAPFCQWRS